MQANKFTLRKNNTPQDYNCELELNKVIAIPFIVMFQKHCPKALNESDIKESSDKIIIKINLPDRLAIAFKKALLQVNFGGLENLN
jgi:hypothetical protein